VEKMKCPPAENRIASLQVAAQLATSRVAQSRTCVLEKRVNVGRVGLSRGKVQGGGQAGTR
jgi:hypothetical protein